MHYKSTLQDLAILRDPTADPVERSSSLGALAFDGFAEVEPIAWELTEHEILRGTAIKRLLMNFFDSPRAEEYMKRAIEALLHDPEWGVRLDAAFGLLWYAIHRPEACERVMMELARRVADDKDESNVRHRCYEDLLKLASRGRSYWS